MKLETLCDIIFEQNLKLKEEYNMELGLQIDYLNFLLNSELELRRK